MADDVKTEDKSFFDQMYGDSADNVGANADAAAAAAATADTAAKVAAAIAEDKSTPTPTPGQETASPPVTDDKGQPVDSPPTKTDDTGAKVTDSPPVKDDKGDETKPPPYDQDPKWLAARAAEKRMADIMDKHGVSDPDELETLLEEGTTTKELLGDHDASQLVKDSEYLKQVQDYWAEQEAIKQHNDESPEDSVKRLQEENRNLRTESQSKDADRTALEQSQTTLSNFEADVNTLVESVPDLDEPSKEMLNLMLGVDNPINEIDISKRGDVRKTAKVNIEKFNTFVKTVKQQAVDQYAAGKSETVPISKSAGSEAAPAVTKHTVPKDASVDETFDVAKKELIEVLTTMANQP